MKTNCGSSPDSITESPDSMTLKVGGYELIPNQWQICPKCTGQGKVWMMPGQPWVETFSGTGEAFECDVCKGKKIISVITGKPPED